MPEGQDAAKLSRMGEKGANCTDETAGQQRSRLESVLLACLLCAAVLSALAALAVAAGGFTWGLPDARHIQSYHPDEQNVTYSLRNMEPSKLDFNPRFFGNPTFYTYQVGAAALAASLVGILPREHSEEYWLSHPEAVRRFYVIGRGLSFAYMLLSLWMAYLVAAKLTARRSAGVVAALVVFSLPVIAVHSHYMTVNSSAVFWALGAVFFALRIRERARWRDYVLAGVFTGFAVSTKLNNAFLPLAILAAHLQAGDGSISRKLASGRLWACAGVCVTAFFVGSPYYVLSYSTVSSDPHNRMNMAAFLDFSSSLTALLVDFWNHLSGACGRVMAGVLLATLPLALVLGRKAFAPILAVIVPFLLIAVKSGWWAFASRMMPLIALLAVSAVVLVLTHGSKRALRAALAAALVLGLLATIPWNLAYFNLMSEEHIRSQSSRWIEWKIPEGSRIIVLDTPYFDDPDIVYENALHGETTVWPRYEIVNLEGRYGDLANAEGRWLVIPQRFEEKLTTAGFGGSRAYAEPNGIKLWPGLAQSTGIRAYAESNGFTLYAGLAADFRALGRQLRDWAPADMVQAYPVYIFRRVEPETNHAPTD